MSENPIVEAIRRWFARGFFIFFFYINSYRWYACNACGNNQRRNVQTGNVLKALTCIYVRTHKLIGNLIVVISSRAGSGSLPADLRRPRCARRHEKRLHFSRVRPWLAPPITLNSVRRARVGTRHRILFYCNIIFPAPCLLWNFT